MRILIVDDHPVVLQGLQAIISATDKSIDVVGTASSADEAIERARQTKPDLVLMDMCLGDGDRDGVTAGQVIMDEAPRCRVLMLSSYKERESVVLAIKAGVAGFALKTAPPRQLIAAIHEVAAGQGHIDPTLVAMVLQACAGDSGQDATDSRTPSAEANGESRPISYLTAKEKEVLRLIGRGRSNAEIASELYIGAGTVKSHINRIFNKLGVRDRPQAILVALRDLEGIDVDYDG